MTFDRDTAAVLDALSVPAGNDPRSISRRRFLQAGIVGGAAALIPSWLADVAAAATPIGAGDGILVTVLLGGGNDGLNTVIPIADAAYAAKRGGVAIKATDALPLGPSAALHPKLTYLKERFDAGQVAVLQGVGDRSPDLSHFSAMARWMSGDGTEGQTGWLGRYIDGLPGGSDPFHAVAVGTSVPLTVVGRERRATALPAKVEDNLSAVHKDDHVRRAAECVRAFGAGPAELSWWSGLAAAGRNAVDLTGQVVPMYKEKLASGRLAGQMDLAARVINADLGARVLHTSFGSFDHHANLVGEHANRMGELDAGLKAFFDRLDPRFAGRVTVLTYSEFGRRVQANQSGGTDHGTASALFAIGGRVKGGLYGAMPSLAQLDRSGNLVAAVDHRSVYATLLDSWLRADSKQILGGSFENLGFVLPPAA